MALNDDKVRLFNYICEIEEYALTSAQTKLEVKNWLETQADQRVVLFKDRDGKTTGGRIDLRRKLCSEYLDTGFCHPPQGNCALWHICKRFIEGNCEEECGRSHSFLDKHNRTNTIKAGLENFPSQLIRNIVAYSLPQVCLLYSKNGCKTSACPYLHICSSVVRKTACQCSLSHNLLDWHNEKILERYGLSDRHIWFKSKKLIDFVLCNILHPFRQKVCKKKNMLTGAKTTSEFLTSRKDEGSSIPPDPDSLDLQGGKSTSHVSTSNLELVTSKASSVSPNPTSVATKQTGLLQVCPKEVMRSNRSGSNLTSQDSRSISELHTLKADTLNRPEPGKRRRIIKQKITSLEGQVPSMRLSSNEITNLEPSNPTRGLYSNRAGSKVTSSWQDFRNIPDFHTSKDGALFRPEPEKREKMKQKMALQRHSSARFSRASTTGSKDFLVQYRSVRGLSNVEKYLGGPCISRDDRIPHHWSSVASDTNYTRVKVDPDSSEFKEVETLFRKTMEEDKVIDSFERVENPFLWETYCRKKDRMVALAMPKHPQSVASDIHNEKRLFHGTSPDVVDAICKQNFDWRLCGKSGTKYGEGSYFATNASYSHSYAKRDSDGSRFMFLAKVLVGSYIKGKHEYRRPPNKDPSNPSSDLYDSCVDNECNPGIFVIFDSDQFYPEYVIKYLTLEQDTTRLIQSNSQARTTKSSGIIKSPRPYGGLTYSGSNLQKPVLPRRRIPGLRANPRSPSTSLSANRALSHSASNLLQPIASPRSSQGLTANPKSPSTSLSANRAPSHSASNLLQPIASPRSSQGLTANPKSPSTSLSANRAPSHSASNLLQSITTPRSSQGLTASLWDPSTSLSANRAPSHSASNLLQPIASPRSSQGLTANPKSPSTSLSANRALPHSASNLQQPVKASRSSQGGAANLAQSSSTFTASDSNARSRRKQSNDSKSKKCLIL